MEFFLRRKSKAAKYPKIDDNFLQIILLDHLTQKDNKTVWLAVAGNVNILSPLYFRGFVKNVANWRNFFKLYYNLHKLNAP